MRKDKKDYEVGYGKPPKESQFKKGCSGNLKGRPKGTKNLRTDLSEELAEQLLLSENGKRLKISKQRAILKALMAKAVQGDSRAAQLVLGMIERLLLPEDSTEEEQPLSIEDQTILDIFLKRKKK